MNPKLGYVDPADASPGDPIWFSSPRYQELAHAGRLREEIPFEVHLRDGGAINGRATATKVAWSCPCGEQLDIISEEAYVVTGGVRIECRSCGRGYHLGSGDHMVGVLGVWEDGSRPAPA